MFDRKPPQCMSMPSSDTIFWVLRRATAGELSSSAMTSDTGRPLMPPFLLMRSAPICRPTSAVLPPAAPAPDNGCSEPILYGLAAPNAARHGAGTSIMAPSAPPPQPTKRRRLTLPSYQNSSSCAQLSPFHFSVIELLPTGFASPHKQSGPRDSAGLEAASRFDLWKYRRDDHERPHRSMIGCGYKIDSHAPAPASKPWHRLVLPHAHPSRAFGALLP